MSLHRIGALICILQYGLMVVAVIMVVTLVCSANGVGHPTAKGSCQYGSREDAIKLAIKSCNGADIEIKNTTTSVCMAWNGNTYERETITYICKE
jgi:hypothetical protein